MTALENAGRTAPARQGGRICALASWLPALTGCRGRGHLDQLLPKRQRLTKDHYFALPYDDVAPLMADLRRREGVAA